jgi:Tol biopolymer transport system component
MTAPALCHKIAVPACLAAMALASSLAALPGPSNDPSAPKYTIEDDCSAFAFSSDDHVAYAVRRVYNWKKYTVEGDDLWVAGSDGNKRKRLIDGERLVKTANFHSYAIHGLRWSPDNRRLAIEESTEKLSDTKRENLATGETIELMDSDGHEISIKGAKEDENPFIGASQGTWLSDGTTLAYLVEALKPKLLYEIHTIDPATGKSTRLFADHLYAGVAFDPVHSTAFAIERDKGVDGPADLVWLDLAHNLRTHVSALQGYQGQLTISPSGRRVGFFRDGDYLEVRDITSQSKAGGQVLRVGYGRFEWSPDERYILLKRGPETRSNNLVWIRIADGEFIPAIHDLVYRDFHISPDGHWIGLEEVGKRIVKVYSMSAYLP